MPLALVHLGKIVCTTTGQQDTPLGCPIPTLQTNQRIKMKQWGYNANFDRVGEEALLRMKPKTNCASETEIVKLCIYIGDIY